MIWSSLLETKLKLIQRQWMFVTLYERVKSITGPKWNKFGNIVFSNTYELNQRTTIFVWYLFPFLVFDSNPLD